MILVVDVIILIALKTLCDEISTIISMELVVV